MNKLKSFGLKVLKWRYVIGFVAFIIGVSLQLHGSSISNWNNFGVRETKNGNQQMTVNQYTKPGSDIIDIPLELRNWVHLNGHEDGTIIGVPRMIRTDEWLVQTPFYISQANTGAKFVNKHYGLSGQNMMIAYNAPVKDISVIGKPFNWGYLFLGASYGISWYWCSKIILMVLLAYEFSMILTKGNRLLSVIGSFWITFTPAIQWWFMQHLGDVVFYSLAIMVLVYHYLRHHHKYAKIGIAILLSMSIIGFVLVIYPGFQVTFAYYILGFLIIEFGLAFKEKRFTLFDTIIVIITLLSSFSVIGLTLLKSKEAIQATLNTVYPGHRISSGGTMGFNHLSDLFTNLILPFKMPTGTNQVEASTSINLFPMILGALPFTLKKEKLSENAFGLFTIFYGIFLFLYTIIGVPTVIAKMSLFSYVTSSRSWQTFAVIAVFATLWFIAYLWEEKNNYSNFLVASVMILILALLMIMTVLNPTYIAFIGKKYLLVIIIGLLLMVLAITYHKKWLFTLVTLAFITISGMTVNPLVKGLSTLTDKKLSQGIIKLVEKDPKAKWISEGSLYNYPQMFGAYTLNSVRFYPDISLMKKIDKSNQFENAWNRYSHMQVFLTSEKTKMEAPVPDVLNLQLNKDELSQINVTYVLSHRNLNEEYGSSFDIVYGPDKDGNRIYQLQKEKNKN